MTNPDPLLSRAKKLGLYGLAAAWDDVGETEWITSVIEIEEQERGRRSLERRIRRSKIGRFKPIADFDWSWPTRIDRELIEDVLELGFLAETANVVVVGPNGVGKTTIAANIGHAALLAGHTVLRVTASEMLNDLALQDTSTALERRLRRYTTPSVLLIDEVGYLSYDNQHGDLLFEIISRRHEQKSVVLTTNRPFAEWNETFPNSSSVTALIDRLVHKAEIIQIEGESYRAKEAKERAEEKARQRKSKRRKSARKVKT
jgi:DNA replication protein DnaC